jgi:hypothetical protein
MLVALGVAACSSPEGAGHGQEKGGKVESEEVLNSEAQRVRAAVDQLVGELPQVADKQVQMDSAVPCDSAESPGPDGKQNTDYYWNYAVKVRLNGTTGKAVLEPFLQANGKREPRDRSGITYKVNRNGIELNVAVNEGEPEGGVTGFTRCISTGKELSH